MSQRRKLSIVIACLALLVVLFALKINAQIQRGEDIFWLAELWAPAAVLSVGLVTCIEFMVKPKHSIAPPLVKKAKKPRKR